jgi:hypothetical protein
VGALLLLGSLHDRQLRRMQAWLGDENTAASAD